MHFIFQFIYDFDVKKLDRFNTITQTTHFSTIVNLKECCVRKSNRITLNFFILVIINKKDNFLLIKMKSIRKFNKIYLSNLNAKRNMTDFCTL